LQLDLSIDDPKAYTKTWGTTKTYKLKSWDISEDICVAANAKHFEQGSVKPASSPPAK
jgi:ABC-type transport system substrate-binding protein